MALAFQNILIVVKPGIEQAKDLAHHVASWLSSRGAVCVVQENSEGVNLFPTDSPGFDLILVLAGDGTMLSVVRQLEHREIPLLGINLGQVGFLTEISPDHWQTALTEVFEGHYAVSRRAVLDVSVHRAGKIHFQGRAVNDVVISRGHLARLIRLKIWYGDEKIGNIRADGLIISTPTGSSAYNVSAGGPLLHPDLDVLALTPICPFLSNFPAMVLPSGNTLTVEVDQGVVDAILTEDGQRCISLEPQDRIDVAISAQRFLLVEPFGSSFFSKLKTKGFIKES